MEVPIRDSIESNRTLGVDMHVQSVGLLYVFSKSCLHIHTFSLMACIVALCVDVFFCHSFEAKPVANC